jgi:uncharacterized protein
MSKADEENRIISDMLLYGKDILNSDIFRQAAHERHHLHGTVADHTINVCIVSLRLANQPSGQNSGVNKETLVHAALCHDLGMVSRDSKYGNNVDAWRSHPKESARIAKELIPDLSPEAEKMILSHMWPIAGPPPSSNEGILLCMADKYASMADWKSWLTRKKFAKQIKDRLEEEGSLNDINDTSDINDINET